MLILNIKCAKLGFFKNAREFWSLVFVEGERDLGLCLLLAVQNITAQLCKCGAEAAALVVQSQPEQRSRPSLGFCSSGKLVGEH